MVRKSLYIAALAAVYATSLWAASSATFILANGERHSGSVDYGRGDNNIVDSRFHLSRPEGEETFGLDEVAVIEFVNETPASSELQALPTDSTGLMVMRNGSTQRGHLHNMISGEQVQWVNEAGQRNNYPIQDVKRLYLNGELARRVFKVSGSTQSNTAGGQASVRVEASQPWTDTGITVKKGDRLTFRADGEISVAPGANANPDGAPGMKSNKYPVPANQAGTLIGRVGSGGVFAGGRTFAIGTIIQPIKMQADGRLMLGINDDNFGDNSGAFSVTINKQ
jgi:hypothetical protein